MAVILEQLPTQINIIIVQGDSFARNISITKKDGAIYVPQKDDRITFTLVTAGSGSITVICYDNKPPIDIQLKMKGLI